MTNHTFHLLESWIDRYGPQVSAVVLLVLAFAAARYDKKMKFKDNQRRRKNNVWFNLD